MLTLWQAAGDLLSTPPTTWTIFFGRFLDSVSQVVDVVLPAIGLWVVLRIRSISKVEQSISSAVEHNSEMLERLPGVTEWDPSAPDRRKSSMKGTTPT